MMCLSCLLEGRYAPEKITRAPDALASTSELDYLRVIDENIHIGAQCLDVVPAIFRETVGCHVMKMQ